MKMGFICSTFLLSFLVEALLICIAFADVHNYDFVLSNIVVTRMGLPQRILAVNGQYPGPEIRAHRGDTVTVSVINEGDYGVTIHWHGVKQPRNPWSDGPEYITQCPIEPGTSFQYEIILSDEEGTLWWHAHSDWTRTTVYGAFVVLPPDEVFPTHMAHDDEHTLLLGSWYNGDIYELIQELSIGCGPPAADALTINGQPGDFYNSSRQGTHRVNVIKNNTYLLRIVNGVLNENNFLAVAKHNLTVVGLDGAYLSPFSTSHIMIAPGQTMDVLLNANQPRNDYYIAAHAYADYTVPPFVTSTTSAILHYVRPFVVPSIPVHVHLPPNNDTAAATSFTLRLKHLDGNVTVPTNITTSMYMTIALNGIPCPDDECCPQANEVRRAGSLSNISFELPSTDILQAYYYGLDGVYTEDFPDLAPSGFNYTSYNGTSMSAVVGTKVKVLEYGEQVEIVIQGTGIGTPMNHPMHLHGQNFFLVGLGFGDFDNVTDRANFNLTAPPEMSTVAVPKLGWAAIRFFANNPGVWFMHCHFERHASYGMEVTFIVKNGATEETSMLPPPDYMPHCAAQDTPATRINGLIADRTVSPYDFIMSS